MVAPRDVMIMVPEKSATIKIKRILFLRLNLFMLCSPLCLFISLDGERQFQLMQADIVSFTEWLFCQFTKGSIKVVRVSVY